MMSFKNCHGRFGSRWVSSLVLASIATAVLSGCITRTNVTHVDAENQNAKGIFYYLPNTYLQASPKADGSVSVDPVFFPDPNQKYAIDIEKYLSGYTVDVLLTSEGFLDKIVFNGDSGAVAGVLAEKAADVRVAEITAAAEAEKEQKAKLEAEAKELATSVQTAENAVREAEIALNVAAAHEDYLETLPTAQRPTDYNVRMLAAGAAIAEANIRLQAANEALAGVLSSSSKSAAMNSGSSPDDKALPAPTFYFVDMLNYQKVLVETPPGSGLYEAKKDEEGKDVIRAVQGLELRESTGLSDFKTWEKPKPVSTSSLGEKTFQFVEGSSRFVRPDSETGALQFEIELVNYRAGSIPALTPVCPGRLTCESSDYNAGVARRLAGKNIIVDLPSDIPAAEYLIPLTINYGDGQKKNEKVQIIVEKPSGD